jgi:hypothetical protein
MELTGAVVGHIFGLEGYAFFFEAIFIGLYLHGWDRLGPARALVVRGGMPPKGRMNLESPPLMEPRPTTSNGWPPGSSASRSSRGFARSGRNPTPWLSASWSSGGQPRSAARQARRRISDPPVTTVKRSNPC